MKNEKLILFIIVFVSMFMFTGIVSAAEGNVCSATQLNELRQMAAKVKVTYLPVTEVVNVNQPGTEVDSSKRTSRILEIKIYNLNTRLYVVASSNEIGYKANLSFNDAGPDGAITLRQPAINQKINYEFAIKSSMYGCETKNLRTLKLTLPKFNSYSQLNVCSEIPDYYLCQEYITYEVDGATFYDKVDAYKAKLSEQKMELEENDNTGAINKTFANASKYKYVIVGIIVAIGVVATVFIIKRKENV